MPYYERHGQPGYFRDVTRHFPRDARLLDVGCGTAWLAAHYPEYTGIDSSPEAIATARRLGRNVVEASVEDELPFESESFDAVGMKDLLEHVPDPVAVVREARRVLKPGGRAFASAREAQGWVGADSPPRRPFTRGGSRSLFSDSGFLVDRVGYEWVTPGMGIVPGFPRRKRRPRTFAALT